MSDFMPKQCDHDESTTRQKSNLICQRVIPSAIPRSLLETASLVFLSLAGDSIPLVYVPRYLELYHRDASSWDFPVTIAFIGERVTLLIGVNLDRPELFINLTPIE